MMRAYQQILGGIAVYIDESMNNNSSDPHPFIDIEQSVVNTKTRSITRIKIMLLPLVQTLIRIVIPTREKNQE